MKKHKVFIFISAVTLIVVFVFFNNLTKNDVEWLLRTEWKKRTKQTEVSLNNLPDSFKGYIHMRYEGTDSVRVWGPNGEFIDFGSIVPEDFHKMKCGRVYQVEKIQMQCSDIGNKKNYTAGMCLQALSPDYEKMLSIPLIIENYHDIKTQLTDVLGSSESSVFTNSNKHCLLTSGHNIPLAP